MTSLQECVEQDADALADKMFREEAILEKFRSLQDELNIDLEDNQ